ncbi:MAG: phytanoyl-CoA dioxygenase family protein [Hyphomicrobiales bacterium]
MTSWHQDQPSYYCVDGTDTVSLWILPVDSVLRERTLSPVAGSHKWGKYYRPERFNKTGALNENDGLSRCRTSTTTATSSRCWAGRWNRAMP